MGEVYFDPSRGGFADPEGHAHTIANVVPGAGGHVGASPYGPAPADSADAGVELPAADAGGARTHSPSGGRVAELLEPVVQVFGSGRPRYSARGHRAPAAPMEYVTTHPVAHHAPGGHPQAEPMQLGPSPARGPSHFHPGHAGVRASEATRSHTSGLAERPDVRSIPRGLLARIGFRALRRPERFTHRQTTPAPRPSHGLR